MKNSTYQIIAIIIIIVLTGYNLYLFETIDKDYTNLTVYEEPVEDIAIDLGYLKPVRGQVSYTEIANDSEFN